MMKHSEQFYLYSEAEAMKQTLEFFGIPYTYEVQENVLMKPVLIEYETKDEQQEEAITRAYIEKQGRHAWY